MNEWKVYLDDDPRINKETAVPGKEVKVKKTFLWQDKEWMIPSIYLFEKGIVVDFCVKVDNEKIKTFIEKWNLNKRNDDISLFSWEEQHQIDLDSPMNIRTDFEIRSDDQHILKNSCGMGRCWNACIEDSSAGDADMTDVIEYYNLDKKDSWIFQRQAFILESGQIDTLRKFEVILKEQKKEHILSKFSLETVGEQHHFINPVTGIEHCIEAVNFQNGMLSLKELPENFVYPRNYRTMEYRITPPLNRKNYYIQDISEGDRPYQKNVDNKGSIIGFSACSVSAIVSSEPGDIQAVFSSTHFEPVEEVTWRITVIDEKVKEMSISTEIEA